MSAGMPKKDGAFWKREHERMKSELARERASKAAAAESKIMPFQMTATALAYAEGAIPYSKASRGPRPFFAKLLNVHQPSRFERDYPEPFKDTDPDIALAMSLRRRRKIDSRLYGSWSVLPPELRFHFTEKERAALHAVAGLIGKHGFCDKTVKEIADIAGAGVSTVKTALKEAKALGLLRIQSRPRKGRNHLPSIITIVSVKWRNWLQSLVAKKSATIKNSRDKQGTKRGEAAWQGAYEREKAAPQSIPDALSLAVLPETQICRPEIGCAHVPSHRKPSETTTVSMG